MTYWTTPQKLDYAAGKNGSDNHASHVDLYLGFAALQLQPRIWKFEQFDAVQCTILVEAETNSQAAVIWIEPKMPHVYGVASGFANTGHTHLAGTMLWA